MVFSARDWIYVGLFCWAGLAALVNIAVAQFYFLCLRKRFLTSSNILVAISLLFVAAYIHYSVKGIFYYFVLVYYRLLLDTIEPLAQSWLYLSGISNALGRSPRVEIWIFFLVGTVTLPLLEYKLIFSPWLYRYLHHLAETIKDLKRIRAESDNWTDKVWRRNDTDNVITEYDGSVEDLCRQWFEHWELNHERDFSWPALLAVFFLGEKSYAQTRENLLNDNMEPIRRWSMITGKEIPKW